MDRNRVPRFLAIVTIVTIALFILTAAPTSAAERSNAQAPMRVITKGFTAEQQIERQAELSQKLLADFPTAARDSAFRISLTPEEASAIDLASRSAVPLKIGAVKTLSHRIEVNGLSRGSSDSFSDGKSFAAISSRETGLVWAAVVTGENFGAIRLHIQNFSLPRNVELYFYSSNGQVSGPYTSKGPHGTGDFWTATIFGTEAILQLRAAPNANARLISFRVPEAGLITPHFAGTFQPTVPNVFQVFPQAPAAGWPCGNPSCVLDATCSTTAAPANAVKAGIAKIEWVQGAYIYTCTGGLISENNPSQSNFFLTANHCISKANSAKNANFYWRFATSSCNGTCPSNNSWPYHTSGATVAATGRKGDFSLLHLNANPPAGSVTLGWTATAVANTNGTNLYRISNPNFGPQVYSQHRVDTAAGTCSGWPRGERIYSRDITGAIDGGSSGSPIVNASSQIVGQLSGTCGTNPSDPCSSGPGEANATVDGAFAFYYATVQPILNP